MQGLDEEEDGQIAKKAEIGVEEEAKILRVAGTTLTKIVNPKLANDRDMHISLHQHSKNNYVTIVHLSEFILFICYVS